MNTRRQFLQAAAASGAFFIASPNRVFGAGAPSNRVRLAIVGCHAKGRGNRMMLAALEVPGVEIAYVCDVDARARDYAAEQVKKISGVAPKKEKDLRKVLEDKELDGIISVTPDHWHAYSAVLAMRAGKSVYLEKPCCFCPEEGEILVKTWKQTGKTLQIGTQRRASKTYREAIEWAQSAAKPLGELTFAKCLCSCSRASIGRGKVANVPEWLDWELWQGPAPRKEFKDNIVHYNWHWFRHWGTGETGNNAVHFSDISRWALGVGFPKRVTCSAMTLFPKNDDFEWFDTNNMSFEYAGGKQIVFDISSRTPKRNDYDMKSGCIVYGEKVSIFFGLQDDVVIYDAAGKEIRNYPPADMKVGSLTNPTAKLDVANMADFVEKLRAQKQGTFNPADEGYMSSQMPLLANIAADIRSDIEIDDKTGRPINCSRAMNAWGREYAKGWELV